MANLPSPPPSHSSQILPKQRTHPLKPNSAKESWYIDQVDKKISSIRKRFRLFGLEESSAYTDFAQLAADADSLIDIIWTSATPVLQIQQLLDLTGVILTAIPTYPTAPRAMLRLMDKLDVAFVSLVTGKDLESGAPLPGMEAGASGVSSTERVRINSLASRAKGVVFQAMDASDVVEEDLDDDDDDGESEEWDYEASKVFNRTIEELGDSLDGAPIGIVQDDCPAYGGGLGQGDAE